MKLVAVILIALWLLLAAEHAVAQSPFDYEIHDVNREQPVIVDPGPAAAQPAAIPSDAVVLFDGTDLSAWRGREGAAPWRVGQGYFEVAPGTGDIHTEQEFGDVQLYMEWATPAEIVGEGQGRGNSGVFFMNRYEVQILDSYENQTYPDGQAASLYGQYPPLVNASRAPGEWQTYNIIFRRPRFDPNGNLRKPARVTVIHNNVVVQDNVPLTGPTGHYERPPYEAHEDQGRIRLQDHGDLVRFRNIWVRELPDRRH